MKPIIAVQGLTKSYRSYAKPVHRLLEIASGGRIKRHFLKHALDHIDFELMPGDRLGIMGENGSGKSTLLKILSGVLSPTSGNVNIEGTVAALLELGTGFHADLTGRENVFQNGYIMGYSEEEMQERFPNIAEFSELGESINYPVRSYSSGMLMRLAFACSVFVEPDVLIVDEALAVGDAYFQTKCFYKIKSLIENGTTFLYVSHGQDAVRTLCNKAIVLEQGSIIRQGDAAAVSDFYASYMYAKQGRLRTAAKADETVANVNSSQLPDKAGGSGDEHFSRNPLFAERVKDLRQGNGLAVITDVKILDTERRECSSFSLGDDIHFEIHVEAFSPLSPFFSIGVGIADANGLVILQCSTIDQGFHLATNQTHSLHMISMSCKNILSSGTYSVICGMAEMTSSNNMSNIFVINEVYDVCFGCAQFSVPQEMSRPVWGKVDHHFDVNITTYDA